MNLQLDGFKDQYNEEDWNYNLKWSDFIPTNLNCLGLDSSLPRF